MWLAFLVAACGGDDDSSSDGRSDGTTESTDDTPSDDASSGTTEPATPEEAAVRVYQESNDYMERAVEANLPNPEDPELSNYFSGTALSENVSLLFQLREAGQYTESTLEANPEVVTATAGEVILTDCVTESVTSFDAASGQETGSSSDVYNWRITVVNTESGWRVDEIIPQEQPCTP